MFGDHNNIFPYYLIYHILTVIFRTNHLNSKESISEKIKKNETANIQQQVEIFRKRVECMLKMNCQLQSELKKSVCFDLKY